MLAMLLLFLVLVVGWLATLMGMPGNWLMVVALAVYTATRANDEPSTGWASVIGVAVLALAGEVIELAASAAGMAKGGSKRGALLAMLGAMVGSVFGATLGLPVPVIGPVLGILIASSLGAMAGAWLGETWKGRDLGTGWAIGKAAFFGRLIGSGAKLIVGSVILVVAAMAVLLA